MRPARGCAGFGIVLNGGTITTLTNSGTINGGSAACGGAAARACRTPATITTLTNSGTISGGNGGTT